MLRLRSERPSVLTRASEQLLGEHEREGEGPDMRLLGGGAVVVGSGSRRGSTWAPT